MDTDGHRLRAEDQLGAGAHAALTSFPVFYKEVQVDEYIPDLLVGDEVVVDTKTIERITDVERGQMLNYLRITNRSVGLILNFKRPKLEWERIAL